MQTSSSLKRTRGIQDEQLTSKRQKLSSIKMSNVDDITVDVLQYEVMSFVHPTKDYLSVMLTCMQLYTCVTMSLEYKYCRMSYSQIENLDEFSSSLCWTVESLGNQNQIVLRS